MDDKPSVEQLVSVFIKIRDARDAARREWEEKEADFNEQLAIIDQQLLEICKETGADSIKTKHGTAIRSVKSRYWTNDWEKFYERYKREIDDEILACTVDVFQKSVRERVFQSEACQNAFRTQRRRRGLLANAM